MTSHRYIPNGEQVTQEMLRDLGISSINELFADIPANLRFQGHLPIEEALSESDMLRHATELGNKNQNLSQNVCFLGGGVYDHFRPLIIDHIIGRSEFYTSYTPYQPEIAQGTLQMIFEYQSLICQLTGMDTSNASMYDASNATAEAVLLSINNTRKANRVLVSEGLNPEYLQVIKTYLHFRGIEVVMVPLVDGKTDLASIEGDLTPETACVVVQNPNYYGVLEDVKGFGAMTEGKVFSVLVTDPISLGVLEKPGKFGIDIVVGDGQSLGNGMNLGGPYLGYMAVSRKHIRRIPGRVAGMSRDSKGERAFVLTLQAREQHIRRYKATSNICSNQSLNALVASIYLNVMGPQGLKEVCQQSYSKATYLRNGLLETGLFNETRGNTYFKEFTLQFKGDAQALLDALRAENILGGILLEDNEILIAVTEKRTKEELDRYLEVVRRFQ